MKRVILYLLMSAAAFADSDGVAKKKKELDSRIIPEIAFRDAYILDFVDFFVDVSSDHPSEPHVCLSWVMPSNTNAPPPDPRAALVKDVPPLTIHLKRISILQAMELISSKLGLDYEIKADGVVFRTKSGAILNKPPPPPRAPPPASPRQK